MQAGGGSRGRSPHLAAVGKEGEEVFVVVGFAAVPTSQLPIYLIRIAVCGRGA